MTGWVNTIIVNPRIISTRPRRAGGWIPFPAILMMVAVIPTALFAQTHTYRIVPIEGRRFALEVFKTRLMSGKKHLFLFHEYRGSLIYDRASPEQSKVAFEIESGSLECKDTWVSEKDLQKIVRMARVDMLAVEQHPRISFSSSAIRSRGERQFDVEGQLTIRGISKPALVTVNVDPDDGHSLLIEGKSVVKMRDYGLKPPSAALGMVGTKNEMEVSFTLRAVPQAREQAAQSLAIGVAVTP